MEEVTEQWKELEDFPGFFISDQGRVYNHRRGIYLRFERTTKGHHKVILKYHGISKFKYVHDLVAIAFLGELDDKEVRHKDGNKLNCSVDNLELVPKGTLRQPVYKLGLESYSGVRVVETGEAFFSIEECAEVMNLDERGIQACLDGLNQTHGGFHFVRTD